MKLHTLAGVVFMTAMAISSACTLLLGEVDNTNSTGTGGTGGHATVPCTSAAQCDDMDPCTTDTCSTQGICTSTPIMDGPAPPSSQMKGTCQKIVCKGGSPSSVEDDTNVPAAKDMCTLASCSNGQPTMSLAPAGTVCMMSGSPGTCQGGVCKVACTTASMCPSMGACQVATCDGATGLCNYTNVSDGTPTPGVTQAPGDCHSHVCLSGTDTNAVDDSDIPDIPTAMAGCADAKCSSGTPSNPLHAVDSMCKTWMGTMAGFCNTAGSCVQCNQASECPNYASRTDCLYPTCDASGLCQVTKAPSGTVTTGMPAQPVGNCQQTQCDGNGGTMSVPNDNNLPPALGGGCQPGTCTNGMTGHGMSANGTACGTGLACVGGQCSGCTMDAMCQPPAYNTCGGGGMTGVCGCTPKTCAMMGFTCGPNINTNTCMTTVNCDDKTQDGTETDTDCGGNTATCATRCGLGKKCGATSDCQSGLTCADGVCCNSACTGSCQACTLAKNGQPSGTNQDGQCLPVVMGKNDPHGVCMMQAVTTCGDTGTTCDGAGQCTKYANGTTCIASSCNGNILTKQSTCQGGTCTGGSMQNCVPYKCTGSPAACTTSCTVDSDCSSTTTYYCLAGVCTARLAPGTSCTAGGPATQCQGALVCAGPSGSAVCCNQTCTAKCKSCLGALTGGANGTCANAQNGQFDPSGTCTTTASTSCGTDGKCDGSGNCRDYPAGTACSNIVSCSGNMVTTDTQCNGSGACSSGPMTGPCPGGASCNAGGTACNSSNCAGNDNNCASGFYCNGNTCTMKNGAGTACTADDQCSSSHCGTTGTGFCCASACTTTGACGATGCASTGGTCIYPSATTVCGCTGSNYATCNGAGACGAATNPCANSLVCSGSMCLPNCAGNDNNCVSGFYCNGSNACKAQKVTGSCTADDQCTSGNCGNGGSGNCCTMLSCMGGTCGATSCDATTGACNYAPTTTLCGSPPCTVAYSTITTCNGSGSCGAPVACPGNASCVSDGSACNGTNCGSNNSAGDTHCATGYWCSGTSAPFSCTAALGTGQPCNRYTQCLNGTCASGMCN